MVNNMDITWEETKDPQACNNYEENYKDRSRDPSRTPFQWDATDYAGFTTAASAKPWLPVNKNYKELNLAKQKTDEKSTFKHYQSLTALRQHSAFTHGEFEATTFGEKVLVYAR